VNTIKDDRILPATRLVAALVVPVLILAFIILYLFPETTGERFAWQIKPDMTAAFMGAGYLGGAWLFLYAVFGRRWHHVAPGYLPVAAFTTFMLLDTILHWDRFDLSHIPFLLWLALYVVTPFLLPFLWWRNRVTDPGTPEADDVIVPQIARWSLGGLGVLLLGFALFAFLAPDLYAGIWTWQLSPLTARIMAGWLVLLGTGGLVISQDDRWSAWRVGLESIGIWQILVLVAAFINHSDFPDGLLNWYLIAVAIVVAGMAILYVTMESRRRAQNR
jgi:hypothetical protein